MTRCFCGGSTGAFMMRSHVELMRASGTVCSREEAHRGHLRRVRPGRVPFVTLRRTAACAGLVFEVDELRRVRKRGEHRQ